ncbi:MAG TPA: cysteine hydrolase [Leptolyngbya sp.]|jgi:nicotinamidase-related amidase|nr:cysteine hydrolase [Leptolyngbya sp.]
MNQPFVKQMISTRQHPFEIVLAQTALLVIDMQVDFCDRFGFCSFNLKADVSMIQTMIPRLQQVLDWARRQGLWIIYTRESHKPNLSDLSFSKQLRYMNAGYPVGSRGKQGRFLIQGEAGTEIISELAPQAADWELDKPAQSAFVGTLLEQQLRDRNITHLLITGVTTECCVLGTYRQANDLGFYSLLLEDCCAAFDVAAHEAAIAVLLAENGAIGWITTSEQLLQTVQ